MTQLSTTTISKLADALAPSVVDWLIEVEYLTDTIPPFIDQFLADYMGQLDPALQSELGCLIFERICLATAE